MNTKFFTILLGLTMVGGLFAADGPAMVDVPDNVLVFNRSVSFILIGFPVPAVDMAVIEPNPLLAAIMNEVGADMPELPQGLQYDENGVLRAIYPEEGEDVPSIVNIELGDDGNINRLQIPNDLLAWDGEAIEMIPDEDDDIEMII